MQVRIRMSSEKRKKINVDQFQERPHRQKTIRTAVLISRWLKLLNIELTVGTNLAKSSMTQRQFELTHKLKSLLSPHTTETPLRNWSLALQNLSTLRARSAMLLLQKQKRRLSLKLLPCKTLQCENQKSFNRKVLRNRKELQGNRFIKTQDTTKVSRNRRLCMSLYQCAKISGPFLILS